VYSPENRLLEETDTLGNTVSRTYDARWNILTETNQKWHTITHAYHLDTRHVSQSESDGSGNTITTNYGYDALWNLVSVTDAGGNITHYEYDALSRPKRTIYPDSTSSTTTYDANNNPLTILDPNGTLTTQTYDSENRRITRSIDSASGSYWVTSESYVYDALGRLTSGTNSISWNTLSTLTFTYDTFSRLTSETSLSFVSNQTGSTKTITYTYDNNSNITSLTHPDGQIQTYTYDALNRNTTIGYSWQTIATYTYSGLTLTSLGYLNGRITNYTYDTLQRLSGISGWAGITPYNYTYDDSSLITADGTKSYTYDNLKRLISATPTASGTVEAYTYDKTGNRKTDASSTYAVNTLDQYTTITGSTNKSYTYDNNGNLKSDGSKSFIYDYNNRLIQINQGTGIIVQYQYDILGRRIQKITNTLTNTPTNNTESTIYIYAWDNIIQEIKTTGWFTLKKTYINGLWTDNLIAYDAQESTNQDKISFCQTRVLPYQSEFQSISNIRISWNIKQ
jgi:YD repeat-containing protein